MSAISNNRFSSISEDNDPNQTFEPYIGPRSFRRDVEDRFRFFGRDTESDEIISLVSSHKLSLVYAQSGAGKTSIFNAQIIPRLEKEGFDVLPIARVQITHSEIFNPDIPTKKDVPPIKNLYLYNALLYMCNSITDNDKKKKIDYDSLPNIRLFEFLDDILPRHRDEFGNIIPQVLIFDQLEELFTYYPDRWIEQQKDFFRQIADSLENNPVLRIVFIIREDYLAQLEPFERMLPEKLRPRFRLERLRRNEAAMAIKGPLTKQ